MSDLFTKISTDIRFSWDIRELEKQFIGEVTDPSGDTRGRHLPYSDPLKRPHWQKFPAGILFARNFSINFPKECMEVTETILNLQNELKKTPQENEIIKVFLNHRVNSGSVNIIKVHAGTSVAPHDDVTRFVALNIGLSNSNSCETQIINTIDNRNFDHYDTESFIMNDGDAYLLKVTNSHRVNSLVTSDSGLNRYLITYTIPGMR